MVYLYTVKDKFLAVRHHYENVVNHILTARPKLNGTDGVTRCAGRNAWENTVFQETTTDIRFANYICDPVNYNDHTGEIPNILVGAGLGGFVKDVLTGAVAGGLGSVGFYGAGKAAEVLRGSVAGRGDNKNIVPKPNYGQGVSKKGYFPKPGERTFEGFVKEWVPIDAELSLYTKSKKFNNVSNIGGVFKRFGTKFGRHGIAGE